MQVPPTTGHPQLAALTPEELAAFEAALMERRRLVYDFLENWPGAERFRPEQIHDAAFSYIKRRGKALRPMLLLLSCGAVGGDEQVALPAAAAVEVYQTWTLVHDDIIDRDQTRRGRPTVHAEYASRAAQHYGLAPPEAAHYGTTVAILTGDIQQAWCYALMAELAGRGVDAALVLELIDRMASSLTPQLLEGEMLDVQYALVPPDHLTEEDILAMLTKKTGSLLEYAAWCGAKIGLAGKPDPHDRASRLSRFAYLCGTAFQLRDDLLGLVADEQVLGKPVGSDLREGKRTLVVFHALARATERDRTALLSVLGNANASPQEIRRALDIINSTGAGDEVARLANRYIADAMRELYQLPDTPHRRLLESWAKFLLARQH
jgi:geranylgeranyl diphosphate synthase type I